MVLEQLHKAVPIHLFGVVERHELEGSGISRNILEGALDAVQIMRPNGDDRAVATEGAMQLVLEIDEGLIGFGGELNVAEDGRDYERAHLGHLHRSKGTDSSTIIRSLEGSTLMIGHFVLPRYISRLRVRLDSHNRSGRLLVHSNLKNSTLAPSSTSTSS